MENVKASDGKTVQAERRTSRRRRIAKPGLIWCEQESREHVCVVVDVSDSGARIKFVSSAIEADQFELRIEIDRFAVDCEVVWRRGHEMGLKFTGEPRELRMGRPTVV